MCSAESATPPGVYKLSPPFPSLYRIHHTVTLGYLTISELSLTMDTFKLVLDITGAA